MIKSLKNLRANHTPFTVVRYNNKEVEFYYSSKRGLYGAQVTAMLFIDDKFDSHYKTCDNGYQKFADAFCNILPELRFNRNKVTEQLKPFYIGGNFYNITDM